MIIKPKISVVIPTYNRPNYIKKILQRLVLSNIPNEIIICDGGSKISSKKKIKSLINNYNFHKIKYIDVKVNNHSKKRNEGIKSSIANYIILLDDDCIPEKKFLEKYFNILDKFKYDKYIFCGSVLYPKNIIKKKFIKYRQSRHFVINNFDINAKKFLHPRNIVTMNMAFKKNLLKNNKIFFYEKFNIYGFEDYELGYRIKEKSIKFVACNPVVFHNDERSFKQYLDKIKFLGYESGDYLIKINKRASEENNFIKIQNNIFIKMINKSQFFLNIFIYFEKLFIKLENKLHYPNFVYKILIANSYLIGHFISKNKKNDKIFAGWYK